MTSSYNNTSNCGCSGHKLNNLRLAASSTDAGGAVVIKRVGHIGITINCPVMLRVVAIWRL